MLPDEAATLCFLLLSPQTLGTLPAGLCAHYFLWQLLKLQADGLKITGHQLATQRVAENRPEAALHL